MKKSNITALIVGIVLIAAIILIIKILSGTVSLLGGALDAILGFVIIVGLVIIVAWMFIYAKKNKK